MKFIFYAFGFLAIVWEIYVLVDPVKMHAKFQSMKKKENKNRTPMELVLGFMMLFYMLWTLIGLMSSQWLLFLVLIIMSLIPKPYVVLRWIDSLLTVAILIFMILNISHLHIDLINLL